MSAPSIPHGPPQLVAPYYPPMANYSGMSHPSSSILQKPKVGLAVLCRCTPGNNNVQCLLQKRGQHSASPNKWSFPGGRLERPGDLEDDGAVGTRRELNEECGGGSPQGLPPLIHIECCKSGKSQTLYHVFVVDMSLNKEWELWQPKYRNGKGVAELDTMVGTLNLQGKFFTCNHGYCWVDMSVLIRECYDLNPSDQTHSDLQYGLVRWVQNYGEHILKTLIARSPKLPHPRRLANPTATTPPSDGPMMLGMPRLRPSRQDSGGKPRRFEGGTRGAMLHPGYHPGPPFVQSGALHLGMNSSPTNAYYNVLPLNPSQLSPPIAGSNAANMPTNGGGGGNYPGNLIMHIPPGLAQGNPQTAGPMGQGGLIMMPPIMPPTADSSTQPSSPVLHSQISASLSKSEGNVPGLELSSYQPPQTQSLMSTHIPLMATSSLPIAGSPGQQVVSPPSVGSGGGGGGGVRGPPYDVHGPPGPGHSVPVSTNHQFMQPQPPSSSNTPLPSLSHSLPAPLIPPLTGPHPLPSHAPMMGGDPEPLLPNPPLPSSPSLLPLVPSMAGLPLTQGMPHPHFQQHPNPLALRTQLHQQPLLLNQIASRKEIVCRHYLRGVCPYDEKCWFAHPDPLGQSLRADIQGSPIPPLQIPHQYWMSNPVMDYMALHSPPQSPMTPPFMPRPGMLPSPMFRPRGSMSYPGQQPYMFYRGNLMGNSRAPGSNLPLLPANPIPMPLNPLLKFGLLSRVNPQSPEGEEFVQMVSRLETYADHFFVSHESNLSTYKIIFGGNRNCHETAVPTEKKKLEQNLSCLYCSTLQPMLLLLGAESGDVSFLDLRKGASHGNTTPVYSTEMLSEPVSALTHFSTSFNSAQVVVVGNERGVVTWYISQPPQKTYSLLYSDKEAHTPYKIVALQMLGGFLVSTDSSGFVVIWSMMSHNPAVLSSFKAHSLFISNLHVVDASHFITVGAETNSDVSRPDPATNGTLAQHPPVTMPPDSVTLIPSSSDSLEAKMGALTVNSSDSIAGQLAAPSSVSHSSVAPSPQSSSIQFKIKLWEFDKPPKMVREVSDIGAIVCSSFHCHNPPGNMFLGIGMRNGVVRVYNVPDFTLAAEILFAELAGADCIQIRLNLSREAPVITPAYYRNPFRDLILTSAWSDGKIMVCQVAKQ